MKKFIFTTTIHKEGKWFVAQCDELGVVTQGKTLADAKRNLREAVELFLEDMPVRQVPQKQSLIGKLQIRHALSPEFFRGPSLL